MYFQKFPRHRNLIHQHPIRIPLCYLTPGTIKIGTNMVWELLTSESVIRMFWNLFKTWIWSLSCINFQSFPSIYKKYWQRWFISWWNLQSFPGQFLQNPRPLVYWHRCMVVLYHPCWTVPIHHWCAKCSFHPRCCSWCRTPSIWDLGC